MTLLIPVILSGGAGTRLWPLSREMYPKQLLALTGKQTMLQDTATRLAGIAGAQPPIVVCNEAHRFTVAEQIRALGIDGLGDSARARRAATRRPRSRSRRSRRSRSIPRPPSWSRRPIT